MDLILQREVATVDPSTPFRATEYHVHHTWAKTFHTRPELYIRPHSTEEIRKAVNLARSCRKRVVTVGSRHSPSDITCSSSWMVNLDHFSQILNVDISTRLVTVQSGIRLFRLGDELEKVGLALDNLGSIDEQSAAGVISTGTHGSSLKHGLISQSVRALKIMLANGEELSCSAEENVELFRAALLSLGALGIITEITFEAVPSFKIEWTQSLQPLDEVVQSWGTIWREAEFVRCWWLPYLQRAIVWKADKTEKPLLSPQRSWYGGFVGFHTYQVLLYISNWFPRLLPAIEWFVFGMQYGFKDGASTTAVEPGRTGLLMDCLFSQFVNEWAIPLEKGPEAIQRISLWLNGQKEASGIPFDNKGLYVHSPVEVRVSDTSISTSPRPYLDQTVADGPTLYLNFTLYRPFYRDPPCRARYYEAVEWLMKELGGRPHWAKNFDHANNHEIEEMYPELGNWQRVRDRADPEGMFVGDWHRRHVMPEGPLLLPLEEREKTRVPARGGGVNWFGQQALQMLTLEADGEDEKLSIDLDGLGGVSEGGKVFLTREGREALDDFLDDLIEKRHLSVAEGLLNN
ncbi:D-arabinono-1,4-lactone oxidase [Xylona heveae TC161]|uniref:D-arabinono-1,4-lactone oxidase n=1 Tax=Xylona heveae (strain CBS 132557 / TC161) TaxID=1328760 RepID=A0A164ZZ35_XYLHT|nr:D-arabinono-1,4-lactone oxidase [Xylona heveae TC161]KZF19728.1 D-arabinono-1,4-lactone oxidase [Xylona heveae TC161]